MQTFNDFKIGQWVKSYSKGIHRIEKFIPIEYEEYHHFVMQNWEKGSIKADQIGTLQKEPLVILKRLFNSKFKKQIGADFCNAYNLKPLDKNEQLTIDEQLATNPKLLTDLDKYEIPKFETRYGLYMLLTTELEPLFSKLATQIRRDTMTFTDIFQWFADNNIKQFLYRNTSASDRTAYYLQFINWSFESKGNRLLFSDLLAFTPDLKKIETP